MLIPYVQTPSNSVKHTPVLTPPHTQSNHLKVMIDQMDLNIKSPTLAGRLSHNAHNWTLITQDQWVLQAITGYQLELTQTPNQARQRLEISSSLEEQAKISQEVMELLAKGAIIEARPSPLSYVSQIFLVEKKGGGGGQRPVINLYGLNNFVKMEHFKMEGLHLLPDIIQLADWMVKLDLKDEENPAGCTSSPAATFSLSE